MDSIVALILRARQGDADAYGLLVRCFQDMAVGYGYSILGDFQFAEDATQEAFLEAYRDLPKLREPAAFPGWFRRIVFKQCDRMIPGKSPDTIPLEMAEGWPSDGADQAEVAVQRERQKRVLEAIDGLPEHERVVALLYYISGYSQKEIGGFLDLIDLLLDRGADVDARDHEGKSPLRIALDADQYEVAGRLRQRGAKV